MNYSKRLSRKLLYGVLLICQSNCGKDLHPIEKITDLDNTTVSTPVTLGIDSIGAMTGSSFIAYGHTTGKSIRERGVTMGNTLNPTVTDHKFLASVVKGNGSYSVTLSNLKVLTPYHIRPYAINADGIQYGKDSVVTTGGLDVPVFEHRKIFIVGSTLASIDASILQDRGFGILERGVVYGVASSPTIENYSAKAPGMDMGYYRVSISNLSPQTKYFVRPYFKDGYGYVYGEVDTFKTIRTANVTAIFNEPTTPIGAEANFWKTIHKSVDSALWYLNHYTSATKTFYINYSPGTPTADDNSDGWIRVGSNSAYWTIGTMMHEMNHGFGNGTTAWWTTIMKNGIYQGVNGQALVKLTSQDSTQVLKGDSQHWWPGGINQNSEVTSSWDYVYNALMMEAFRKDGLDNAGKYQTP